MAGTGYSVLFMLLVLANAGTADQPTPMAGAPYDNLALMSFKSLITSDPLLALASWSGNQSLPLCQWHGVKCGAHGRRRGRVVALDLSNLGLVGTISPSIGNLTYLRRLNFPMNRLRGTIPPELGHLLELRYVNLSFNSLVGGIPGSLSECKQLETISLAFNNLTGGIPPAIGVLSSLHLVYMQYNMLEGSIPGSLGSLQNLEVLNLYNNSLTGSIPSEIGNLTSLLSLDISYNNLTGLIPSSLGNLRNIEKLRMRGNHLEGSIPSFLGNLSSLISLNLGTNRFQGEIAPLQALPSLNVLILQENNLHGAIPSWLGNLSSLLYLSLGANSLIGAIPESLGNLGMLSGLVLAENNLTGSIPSTLGKLHALSDLFLDQNHLTGSIPSCIFNLSSLSTLNLHSNQLTGSLLNDKGIDFPALKIINVGFNQFHGVIPPWLCNSSMLNSLAVEENMISGTVPPCLGGRLKSLSVLTLEMNQLQANDNDGWDFILSLTNSSQLRVLDFSSNKFQGVLPNAAANLSTNIQIFNMDHNMISGNIPEGIGNLVSLSYLLIGMNNLEGSIPASLGRLQRLSFLDLGMNNLSGHVPPTFGNLTLLNKLDLGQNSLSGPIPSSLGSCPLELFDVQNNRLSGPIPKEVFLISSLSDFMYFQGNLFSGPLPPEIGNLKNLADIDFSGNQISGEIPASIGDCQSLQYLQMQGNLLQGTIPVSMEQLKGLEVLDLSHNNLSGNIPQFLANMKGIASLNLSFNYFEGEVPKDGIFLNASAVAIEGNHGLCGGISELMLAPCSTRTAKSRSWRVITVSISSAVLLLTILLALFTFWYNRSKSRRANTDQSLVNDLHIRLGYADLVHATNGFDSGNLIGEGSFGSVYIGRMMIHDEQVITIPVKVLNMQKRGAAQSFVAECETLRSVRHRNLVKILTVCSSIDFQGNDFKALVYEFVPNGNLDQWLHQHHEENGDGNLLNRRLSIAIDVASALDYLHQHRPSPIIHCDLKPSNILLDTNMAGHVGDFGLARVLHQDNSVVSEKSSGWATMRGTIGYAAPEYGLGNEVSILGDVYSYGILLLEMFTGKRPTDSEFGEALSLHKYVQMALPERVISIVDRQLLSTYSDGQEGASNPVRVGDGIIACITSVLHIGISCSKDNPNERIQIRDALKELQTIRDKLSILFHDEGLNV